MPPRGRSKTAQDEVEAESPTKATASKLPPPDPAAVQRLVDHAIQRAHSSRGNTPRRVRRVQPQDESLMALIWNHFFGNTDVVYNPKTASKVTEAVGMFLVVIFAFYFTAAGYLWYRETALAAQRKD